jgi:prolyl-tRNA synthetase
MKDLYTFDCSSALALQTYHQVRAAYARLFDELKLPYLVAEADSGDMGGDLSHEFHFPTSKGEDHVISCSDCDYVANEERAESPVVARQAEAEAAEEGLSNVQVWHGISEDGLTLIKVWYASSPLPPRENAPGISSELNSSEVNVRAVKQIFPQLDPTIDEPLEAWGKYFPASGEALASRRIINLLDCTLSDFAKASLRSEDNRSRLFSVPMQGSGDSINVEAIFQDHLNQEPLSMLRIKDGDVCPRCTNGSLRVQKTIELGHTFHLGTRYSVPLEAIVKLPTEFMTDTMKHESQTIESRPSTEVPMQMGCHGIGVSRIVGAVADTLADEKGLNWPRVMAPFEVVVVPGQGLNEAALGVYDALGLGELDVVLDDRSTSLPWKLQDADLIGYPVIVIVGRSWNAGRMCEVQCRRLHIREQVSFEGLLPMVKSLLEKL